ncbi:hypothetical protein Ahy_B06g083576 [Arachis hypogaea]|uniref:RRM domain-containing protein n=1 Tax=Arachis hypogaea TaxID=3818 RepID=A0A444YQ04_ARAHY|nr:hypothetical protein Ahy_B06g083576 [Arachis hypogaea]
MVGPDLALNGWGVGYSGQLPGDAVSRPGPETVPLPPDASSTLYVEGLPSDSKRRGVTLRLVSKESKHRGGDPLILRFVDFANPSCAATAISALQGSIYCLSMNNYTKESSVFVHLNFACVIDVLKEKLEEQRIRVLKWWQHAT